MQEETLVEALRRVPEGAAKQVVELTHRLAAAAERGTIDWSAEWSEEDQREYSRASMARLPNDE